MTEVLTAAATAVIAGMFLYITTGPAIGTARARKAVRELVDLRNSLRHDIPRRTRVNEVLDRELDALEKLADISRRRLYTALNIELGLIVLVVASLFGRAYLIGDDAKDVASYITAGLLLLMGVMGFPIITGIQTGLSEGPWKRVLLAGPGVFFAFTFILAHLAIVGTEYYKLLEWT
jgi:hypothetical protein